MHLNSIHHHHPLLPSFLSFYLCSHEMNIFSHLVIMHASDLRTPAIILSSLWISLFLEKRRTTASLALMGHVWEEAGWQKLCGGWVVNGMQVSSRETRSDPIPKKQVAEWTEQVKVCKRKRESPFHRWWWWWKWKGKDRKFVQESEVSTFWFCATRYPTMTPSKISPHGEDTDLDGRRGQHKPYDKQKKALIRKC